MHSFKDALDTSFRVVLDDATAVDLTLVEVRDRPTQQPGWEAFSLLFQGPQPPAFWDGLYDVEHPEVGTSPMFLVAIQPDDNGQLYEAVFNRPNPDST